jgi:hypothetical protein
MRFPVPAVAAVFALMVAGEFAQAQPVPPIVRRPIFSGYGGFYGGGYGAGAGAFYGLSNPALQNQLIQNQMIQQQAALVTGLNASFQQAQLSSGINPNLPLTGRGATFNNLGHWYPTYRGTGVAGIGGFGGGIGGGYGLVNPLAGASSLGGTAGFGAVRGAAGVGAAGGNAAVDAPRTAGNGIPIRR